MKLFSLLFIIGLTGCSANTENSLPSCSPNSPLAILCLGSFIATAVDIDSSKKCSAMTGEQKKSCDAQVESLKKYISDASRK